MLLPPSALARVTVPMKLHLFVNIGGITGRRSARASTENITEGIVGIECIVGITQCEDHTATRIAFAGFAVCSE